MRTWSAPPALVAILAAASLAGCQSQPGDLSEQTPPDQPIEEIPLGFATTYQDAVNKLYQTDFSVPQSDEIFIALRVPAEEGVRVARVLVALPDGTPFKEYWHAFSATPYPGETVPHPMQVARGLPVDASIRDGEFERVFLSMAIGGSQVTRFGLEGAFQVSVSFAPDLDKVVLASTFDLVVPMDSTAMEGMQ